MKDKPQTEKMLQQNNRYNHQSFNIQNKERET